MGPGTLIKQPAESRLFSMEFKGLLGPGEAIASVTSAVAVPDATGDATLVVGSPTFSGTVASVRISGGTSGNQYVVTILVVTTGGNTVEGEGILLVKDL